MGNKKTEGRKRKSEQRVAVTHPVSIETPLSRGEFTPLNSFFLEGTLDIRNDTSGSVIAGPVPSGAGRGNLIMTQKR